ncbi:uncharacterized protein LOC131675168 [Phymastichus coffea]|uniref:uncharacterized protein LOC131675168 n=1 Tax=Phymastichus coffea TaxID=108790 RepID=UPI00273C5AA8|nr:uncharacterized protein LOC131675168 [Phymastichus coffea]
MDDLSKNQSSSVTDLLSVDSRSMYDFDTESCNSLIAGFDRCNLIEKNILSPQNISSQENFNIRDSASMQTMQTNANIFEENGIVDSFQESPLNNKHSATKITHEVGVNTDRSFNYNVKNCRQPYFKFRKHLNQYHNFKRIYNSSNSISKKQQKRWKNYKNHNKNHEFHNRFQFQKSQEDRAAKGFYFFMELMKCFDKKF